MGVIGNVLFSDEEPWLGISPLDQVFIIGATLMYTANQIGSFQLAWIDATVMLDKHDDEAPLVMTGAGIGLHNLSYGAFVIHDNQISAVRVSNAITVSGTHHDHTVHNSRNKCPYYTYQGRGHYPSNLIHFRLRCNPCPIQWGWQHQSMCNTSSPSISVCLVG